MSDTFWDRAVDEQVDGKGTEEWIDEPTESEGEPVTQDTLGLLNLGQLSETIDVRGHQVTLRTLTMDEELAVGLLIRQYEDTQEYGRALATGLIAASVQTIDGKELIGPLGPGENNMRKKFDYVRTRMYWPVIRVIYE